MQLRFFLLLVRFCLPSSLNSFSPFCSIRFIFVSALLSSHVHRFDLFTIRCSPTRTRLEGQEVQGGSTPPSQRLLLTPHQSHLLVSLFPFSKLPNIQPKCSPMIMIEIVSQFNILNPTIHQFSPLTFALLLDYIHLTFACSISCKIFQIWFLLFF